ncbi:O-antigen translocase [Geomonas sp. Red32]|uniref:O-antigen translocase n=1 Tax=Geomonas sp. Red32 TaxID=2912856 RepID=UPI00202CBD79|nr:O-antigen translocase [Geomonas sp. Red32]MCM0082856.1 O-antigen translocase [Geomonas sp. Red32]
MEETSGKTDRQILKSTFVMGASSIVNSLLGIVRTKAIAILLGPAGMGLTGIYITITNVVGTLSGMGVGDSGVRQIAGAFGAGDPVAVARTVKAVQRMALLFGLAGLAVTLIFRSGISSLTFGHAGHAVDVALLSLTVFFGAVSAGQTALIQGMRRIADLAKVSICGALLGTVLSVPAIYFLGERGIVLYLVIVSATAFLASWWYSSRIPIPAVATNWRSILQDARPLLKLGLALMSGALMSAGTQYLLRVLIVREMGLPAAGAYHASTTLSLVYVGVILNAMLTDFYPRLSAVSHDHDACTTLINKQIEIGLLLAVPGILAIMTFAPLVIVIFYSSKFTLAAEVLKWQVLGVLLQVVSWPMGFMLRAKGNGKLFFLTELFANLTLLTLAWLAMKRFGVPGIGMAFFAMNLAYWLLIFLVDHFNYGFLFTTANLRIAAIFSISTCTVFLTPYLLSGPFHLAINSLITLAVGAFSFWALCDKAKAEMVPAIFHKIRRALGANAN